LLVYTSCKAPQSYGIMSKERKELFMISS